MAKILLVEDDTNLSEIYQARMEAEGYTVVGAPDGESALALAAKEKPDLIISDVMMPKISGFEMLDILRNTDGLKHTRVIMLTALGQAEDRTRAESLGADKYLVKSQVTLEDIVAAAQELLGEGDQTLPTPAELAAPTVTAAEPAPAEPAAPAPTGPMAVTTAAVLPVAEPPASDDQTAVTNDSTDDAAAAVSDQPDDTAFTATDDTTASDVPVVEETPVLPVAEAPEPGTTDYSDNGGPAQDAESPPPSDTAEPTEGDSSPKVEASESADAETAPTTEVAPLTEPLPANDPAITGLAETEPEQPEPEQPLNIPDLPSAVTSESEAEAPATEVAADVAVEPETIAQAADEVPATVTEDEPVVDGVTADAAPEPAVSEPEIPASIDAPAPEPTPALQYTEAIEAVAVPEPVVAEPVATEPPAPEPVAATPEPTPVAPEPPAEPPAAIEPPAPAAPPTAEAIDEKVVANAVDKLLAKSPSAAAIAPTTSVAKPHKKIIAPIEHPPMPTLQELLAIEAAKDSGVAVAPVGAVTPAGGVSTDDAAVAAMLAQAKAEAAKNPQPKEEEFDPNSISL